MGVCEGVKISAHEDTGSSLFIASQRALHRLHSHVVDLETRVRCAQEHQLLDSTENMAMESEALGEQN
jgi:hypothetical protein